MTLLWFLVTVSAIAFASYAAARWGADSRDSEYSMARVVSAVRRFNDDQVAVREAWLRHHGSAARR